ncbi:hypothetical protein P175DRAFT_0553436 [Aspergillus ochraceoroseus IBT 24754]|uniref:BTB domain-containing protein n=3 Tax=Aspergillus subgen. Nidulantes TaxID=2720870 RepID=A0A0F8VN83_9EURO|nr:uncharacterized protein P175DRAFT_0553436 [Aspergillus ochraceoroseus IBT 24754]KKK21065.1 hypothetical protein AOCH_006613 [Aspergillus ochraceoroseus]KKK24586.1 hypothetical protein ARAM_006900 [Aspergillus rambellii]PTU24153.1 hypothetical protein P175DRAFT_0553436 [Aspergillus ochraceoroseus IBT 24754]
MAPPAPVHTPFTNTLRNLLLKGHLSDMQIICGDFTFNVHRVIVCSQSSFLHDALDSQFEETGMREITLPASDCETVERVLSYMYIQDYKEDGHVVPLGRKSQQDDLDSDEDEDSSAISIGSARTSLHIPTETALKSTVALVNVQVYLAAEKFDLSGLKKLAEEKFTYWARNNWKSTAFFDVIQDVMTAVPPGSKFEEVLIMVISENIKGLVKDGVIIPLLEKFGGLAAAVIARLVCTGRVTGPNERPSSRYQKN